MGKMRKTFVASVSLYIGLASGFIVPLGASEGLGGNSTIKADARFNNLQQTKNMTVQKIENTLLSKHNLKVNYHNEKDLYEYVTEKENNVNERSLIVLNQKFRTPLSNRLFRPHLLTYLTPLYNEGRFPLNQFDLKQAPQIQRKAEKTLFQPNSNREIVKMRDSGVYFAPHNNVYRKDDLMKYNREQQRALWQSTKSGAEIKQDVVQLLKPPLVRSDSSIKISNNAINKDFQQQFFQNMYNIMQTPANTRVSDNFRTKFGYMEPSSKVFFDKNTHRIYTNNIVPEGGDRSREDVRKLFSTNIDEEKNHRLVEDTTEDHNYLGNLYSKHCNYGECLKLIDNEYSRYSPEQNPRSICKCFIRDEVKQRERKELIPFSTEETQTEDTSMDHFLNILKT